MCSYHNAVSDQDAKIPSGHRYGIGTNYDDVSIEYDFIHLPQLYTLHHYMQSFVYINGTSINCLTKLEQRNKFKLNYVKSGKIKK